MMWPDAVQVFCFPLELEYREGSGWLHALAARAGVGIYDHSHVAFLNMNHGPLEPILKQLLTTAFPFLSASMVTRCFVLLLPVGWLAVMLAPPAAREGRRSFGLSACISSSSVCSRPIS